MEAASSESDRLQATARSRGVTDLALPWTWRRARHRRVRRHDRGDFAAGRVRARKRTTPPTDRSLLPVPRPNARATAHSHCKTAIWVLFGTTTPPGNLFSCLEITGTPHNTPRIAIVRRRNDFNAKSASFKNHSKQVDMPTVSIRCSPRRSWCGSTTQPQRDRRPPRRRQASRPC